MGQHGTFYWNELMTNDPAKAAAFYKEVCGWTTQTMPMPEGGEYTIIMAGETMAGGMMDKTKTPAADAPTHWAAYVQVDDVDAAVAKVAGAGGTVLMPCFDVEGVGRIAMIQDPTGGAIGLMTPSPEAAEQPDA